jgi:hypothetical protein
MYFPILPNVHKKRLHFLKLFYHFGSKFGTLRAQERMPGSSTYTISVLGVYSSINLNEQTICQNLGPNKKSKNPFCHF